MTNITNKTLLEYLFKNRIPRRYLKQTDKKDYSASFDELLHVSETSSLFIHGSVGTGKTQVVVDLLAELAEKKKKDIVLETKWETDKEGRMAPVETMGKVYDNKLFRYYSVPELLISIRSMFNSDETLDDFLDELDKYEYLVLDDLGVEKITEWVLETLYVIINRRYDNEQKIIVTSNKNLKEISQALGDRITSRLIEMSKVVKLEGEDKRLK